MGAIQSAINTMSGSVAGAVAVGKHLGQQAESNYIAAKKELPEAKEALQGIEENLGTQYLETDNLKAEFAGIDQSTPNGRLQAVMKLTDIEAGERAIKNLEEKQEAKKIQIKRLEKTVAKAQKWMGGNK